MRRIQIATERRPQQDVHRICADTGAQRWRSKLSSEILSAPLVVDDVVIVRTGDGTVTALGLADGKRRWSYEHPMPSLTLRGDSSACPPAAPTNN